MVVLALFGCAPKVAPPIPAILEPVVLTEENAIEPHEAGPLATPLAKTDELMALAPVLVSRSVDACFPESPLCAAVACQVENRMASGFPSRWTLAVKGTGGVVVPDNQRWILAPQTSETRSVDLPLAAFMQATCGGGRDIQTSSRATACPDELLCVDVVCSAWNNGAPTTAYVDVNLILADGSTFDHDAVAVAIPGAGGVVQAVVRYVPGSQEWRPGLPSEPRPLSLAASCGYWQGNSLLEALPE
ncbi:MAG: hypothetical protein ACJAZO_001546 [Myxococcota bacterium]|jgi:hypothetical protein